MSPKRVLFVCLGNICRSPAAEGVVGHRVAQRGLGGRIDVDSAGTIGYHAGEPADERMRRAAGQRGIELTSRGRRFEPSDFDRFDLIVAMDASNREDLLAQAEGDAQRAKVRLLSDFLPRGAPQDVPDPYYGGPQGFDRVLDMVEQAADPVIDALLGEGAGSP
jgi:protein-tyrosine phosphatase